VIGLAQQRKAIAASGCEVRFDNLTRQLYATDASIYQIVPLGVAFPRTAADAGAVIRAAADTGVSVIPRGAGSGLTGGAIGDGLVVDFARHNRQIAHLDWERRAVRVGAGVVLDQLNALLKPHGFCFGPDVATSSRATLGGMIANNSSGARAPVYGVTADHVLALELVLADGGPPVESNWLTPTRELIARLLRQHAGEITARMPPGLLKRWPGYALDRALLEPDNLNHLLAGSEGTLAGLWSAEVNIVPLPREKGLGLVFFASVTDALHATVELLDLKPAAIEHVDRVLFDQTKGQLQFQAARDLLELDAKPCEAFLIVEFYDDDVAGQLAALERKHLGLRTALVTGNTEMELVWGLRKAGLSLLTGCKGPAKPVTGVEDVAVRPEQLPAYVEGLQSIFQPIGLAACFYGHAAAGLLHIRPVLDLHSGDDLKKFRQVCEQVSALVREFKGSLAAEHGVGIARTEFMANQLGEELLGVMREIKTAFDPRGVFNPGKIIGTVGRASSLPVSGVSRPRVPEFKIDTHLRLSASDELRLPFAPALAFAAKDGSFVRNLEQCNGCGGCLKQTPTMCPTFMATGEEYMSTRGRANAIRAALELRGIEGGNALRSVELEAALSNCLSCKACTTECPSNVNLALLKAELLHARHQRDGLPLRARLLSHVDLLGRVGCLMPMLANAALEWRWLRWMMLKALGISMRRPLPPYAAQRFDHWFARRDGTWSYGSVREEAPAQIRNPESEIQNRRSLLKPAAPRGKVILWDDCFIRYHEPHIGQAAVAVLEAAGFAVVLPAGRRCCGRPAFSQGNLDEAARLGRHNLRLLNAGTGRTRPRTKIQNPKSEVRNGSESPQVGGCGGEGAEAPVLFLEPSCYSMFAEDYRELKLPGAERVAKRCFLFEQFVEDLLSREPDALQFNSQPAHVAIHAHCHAKSLMNPALMERLVLRLPGRNATLLETGCCGMAGAFGALESKYELSRQVGQLLAEKIREQPEGTIVVASGTSCRHQIEHLTAVRPKHMAELLVEALLPRGQETEDRGKRREESGRQTRA